MQACGPVVRPHEILQTLIISIPQPSAAVKSFFELSRNFGAPEAMSAFFFTVSRRQTFRRYSGSPLEARFTLEVSVDNGRLRRPGVSVPTDKGKRGHRKPQVSYVPSCLRRQTAAMPGLPIGSHSSPAAARSTVS